MENQPKKSKALIITIIAIIFLVIVAFLVFKNRDMFGVKTSSTIAKIFSPLMPSTNTKDLNKIEAEAGEDIKKGDNVSVFGTGGTNNPIVMKVREGGEINGYASEDINNGDVGEIVLNNTNSNSFWDSFSGFLDNILGNPNENNNNNGDGNGNGNTNNIDKTCTNGTDNYPMCTGKDGSCLNGTDNYPVCTTNNDLCLNGADNPPSCTTKNGKCANGADNFPLCTTTGGTCTNGTDNPPLCTTVNDECRNGATNPPECNSNTNGECANGADNPPVCDSNPRTCSNGAGNFPLCTTIDGVCMNGATNPPECTVGGLPDLSVSGNVLPTTTTSNTATTLSTGVVNSGGGSTNHSFSSYYSIQNQSNDTTYIVAVVPTLEISVVGTVNASYTFTTTGDYSVRVCVDKNSPSDTGTVQETNEENNCGPITIITVENTLPTTGDQYECSDEKDNDSDGKIDIEDPNCHYDGDLTKEYISEHDSETTSPVSPNTEAPQCSDTLDNDGDGGADIFDANCHEDGELQKTYLPDHYSESVSPLTVNICKDIEQNPLTFTDEEKARLAILLRKFYLISSTLRTAEDITTIYNEIDQQTNFMAQIDGLTRQCYLQTNDLADYNDFCARNKTLCGTNEFATSSNPSYISRETTLTGQPVTRHGNPWFTKENSGSFPYTNGTTGYMNYDLLSEAGASCTAVSGYYYGTGTSANGTDYDCDTRNTFEKYNSCTARMTTILGNSHIRPDPSNPPIGSFSDYSEIRPNEEILKEGCKWKDGVYLKGAERILNIW